MGVQLVVPLGALEVKLRGCLGILAADLHRVKAAGPSGYMVCDRSAQKKTALKLLSFKAAISTSLILGCDYLKLAEMLYTTILKNLSPFK